MGLITRDTYMRGYLRYPNASCLQPQEIQDVIPNLVAAYFPPSAPRLLLFDDDPVVRRPDFSKLQLEIKTRVESGSPELTFNSDRSCTPLVIKRLIIVILFPRGVDRDVQS